MIVLNKVSRQSITVVRVTGIQRSILLANSLIPGYDDPESAYSQAAEDADDSMEWGNWSDPTNLRCD